MEEVIRGLLMEMELYANKNNVPIIGHDASRTLIEVVQAKQPLFILEIGAAIGYSAILLASQAPQARLITIEKDRERAKEAETFISQAGLKERVSLLAGDAGEILPKLNGPFDFVFIDAAKGQYLDYLTKILDKLQPGAVVVADNVLFRGMVENNIVPRRFRTIIRRLKAYLEFVETSGRFETAVLPIGDGLAISYFKG
ncbi:MAG: O-methyltransferase [Negativicutes bacterium]|nr:O-methyltransferase [Negativicutes bacterium]